MFINGKFLGGDSDMVALNTQGARMVLCVLTFTSFATLRGVSSCKDSIFFAAGSLEQTLQEHLSCKL